MKLFLVFVLIGGMALSAQGKTTKYTYVITETAGPTSFDPLDADQTQNLAVARMIYATPVEVDSEDRLSSQILKSFNYDPNQNLLTWTIKENLKYSDGSTLTAKDLAFAVARMAYTRPQFPVLENVAGLKDWLKESEPLKTLPSGIQVKENKVEIRFSKKVKNPLFRFCLELFSVIPKSCVDTKTNKITCAKIPSSGKYDLISSSNTEVLFQEKTNGEQINFKYVPAAQLIQNINSLDEKTILAGNELMYSLDELDQLKKAGKILFLPAARFGILQINPNVGPFKNKICRHSFAENFRRNYKSIVKERGISESSIFTGIVTGYLSSDDLKKHSALKVSQGEYNECLDAIKASPIYWGYVENEKNSSFTQALTQTLSDFGQANIKPKLFKSRKEIAHAFIENEIAFLGSSSGFWAHDPSGDLQMLFTPNLHKPLDFVTTDSKLQSLIRDVVNNPEDESRYKAVNQYLYDEGLINIYSHVRRFYFSKNKAFLKKSPLGYSAPTPWQVFEL